MTSPGRNVPRARGGRSIAPGVAGSRASASAGRPSVRTLTARTCTTAIGAPSPAVTAIANSTTSPRFAESRNAITLRTLSPIRRPSRIAATIVSNASSTRTMSAASRAASVPAAAHRHADVGALEGRGVVDAVAGHEHDLAVRLLALDDRELVGRRHPRVDVLRPHAERLRDRMRRRGVVAGQHRHPDPGAGRGPHGLGGAVAQRVVQREEPDGHEVTLDGRADAVVRSEAPLRHGEHPEPLLGPRLRRGLELAVRLDLPVRQLEQDLGRSLHEHPTPVGLVVDDGHPPALRRERELRHELAVLDEPAAREALLERGEEHGALHGVAHDPQRRRRRPRARRSRRAPPPRAPRPLAAGRRAYGRHAHPVLGQRARLVDAGGRGPPDRLDRREPPDDRTARRHLAGAQGERDRHRRQQPLRDGRDRDGDAGEERLVEARAAREHRGAERQRQPDAGCREEAASRPSRAWSGVGGRHGGSRELCDAARAPCPCPST